jgi:hypothetical protein
MILCMASMESEEEREGKGRKKRKEILDWITIHAPPKEKENADINQMIR